MIALRIEPLPEGGVLVSEVPSANGVSEYGGSGRFFPLLFACSDLGDALDFIKGKLAPVEPEASKPEAPREQVASVPLSSPAAEGCLCSICQTERKQVASGSLAKCCGAILQCPDCPKAG